MNFVRKSPLSSVVRKSAASGIALGIALAFAAVALMFATQAKYRADADFLIVQTGSEGKDFYTLFKSSEYLGNVLSNAVGSERFIDAVIETGALNAKSLPADKGDRLKAWKDMVSVKKNLELGVLSVEVKAANERDAARVASGVAQVLIEKNSLFRSGDEKGVEIRTLSGPIIEYNLGSTKLGAAAAAGFLAGFLIVLLTAVIKNETAVRQSEYPTVG
jgi:capsular polysaccharide biosynthesis protein